MTHDELVNQASLQLGCLFKLVLTPFIALCDAQGLSLAQIRLLLTLANGGPAAVGGIAERLHTGQSAASLLVDRLVRAHLADRADDPADRRRAIVSVTADGEALMGQHEADHEAVVAALASLDDAHLTMLSEALTTLLAALKAGDASTEASR